MNRRGLLVGASLAPLALSGVAMPVAEAATAPAGEFDTFLHGLRAQAVHHGIPGAIADAALHGLKPNQDVIHKDQHQPEFTLTWAQYRDRVVTATRIKDGRQKHAGVTSTLASIRRRFRVDSAPIMGIWGIETDFGAYQGNFQVIEALATLAWFRSSHYFANEAIAAMRIAARGEAPLHRLLGSWAGAMGQPQFMPSVYLTTAVSFGQGGRPNIWTDVADSLASIANYLHKAGWHPGQPSSEKVLISKHFNASLAGRDHHMTLAHWERLGVRRLPGAPRLSGATEASLLLPDGVNGDAYLAFANFHVIRRYNASDLYALAVGDLGRRILA